MKENNFMKAAVLEKNKTIKLKYLNLPRIQKTNVWLESSMQDCVPQIYKEVSFIHLIFIL